MTQAKLALLADMAQPRISAMERPGETAFTVETLVRLAAAFKVGLKVEFVPFSEMLAWENNFCQDDFNAAEIEHDRAFLNPQTEVVANPSTTSQLQLFNAQNTINVTTIVMNAANPIVSKGQTQSISLTLPTPPAAQQKQLAEVEYTVPWELMAQVPAYEKVLNQSS